MYTTIYIPQDASTSQPDYLQCDAIQIPYTDDDHTFPDDKKRRQSLLYFASNYSLSSSSSSSSGSDDELIYPSSFLKRQKILTDQEKRANHIASEKKRRDAINTAFKDMTELIPILRNAPHSKSTILFTAYEYIQHLEERNHQLRDRVAALRRRTASSTITDNHNSYPCLNIPADE